MDSERHEVAVGFWAAVAEELPSIADLTNHVEVQVGDHDVVVVIEMPDNVSAAAFAVAISAGGACKTVKTTPLLSQEEGIAAVKKSASSGYQPPA